MNINHKNAVLLTCFVALLWSTFGLIVKLIDWPSPAIAGGRSMIAVFIMAPFILKCQNRKITPYVISGALCYAAFNYCFSMSTKLATAAIAIAMQYTAPVYVSILAWIFLKEKISKSDIVCIFGVLCGMFLFMMDGTSAKSTFGKLLAVLNGIFFAGMSFSLQLQRQGNPVMSMFIGNIISGFIGIPALINAGLPDVRSLGFVVLAGVLCAATYALYAIASTGLTALETVLLPIIEPVMNPIWVFLIVGEAPGLLSVIGMAIVLLSVTARVITGLNGEPQSASSRKSQA